MRKLNENFELHPEADELAVAAAKFIASLFLPYFKTRAEHSKTKSNESIMKYHEYYKLASQYKTEGRKLFTINSYKIDTTWGTSNFKISSKQGEFPDIILRLTNGYTYSNDGYVNVEENPLNLYILVDMYAFIHSFKKSTNELIDTVKHELRHVVQLISKTGLPKDKVLNRKTDLSGYGANLKRSEHHLRDIEFKTNLHTYAFHIKNYLNKNYPRNQWSAAFKNLISGSYQSTSINYKSDKLNGILNNIDNMKRKDPVRWRQFIKELYNIIFL